MERRRYRETKPRSQKFNFAPFPSSLLPLSPSSLLRHTFAEVRPLEKEVTESLVLYCLVPRIHPLFKFSGPSTARHISEFVSGAANLGSVRRERKREERERCCGLAAGG